MKTNIIIATLVAGFALVAGTVNAQTVVSGGFGPTYGSGYYGYGYHSSTYEEGVLRGAGAYLRGAGEFNYLNSQAAINWQQARSAALDNHLKGIDTYFAARRANAEARAAERGPRLTQQELAEIARKNAPVRLEAYEYEPAIGRVFWPKALTTPQFSVERAAINHVMQTRNPTNSGLGSESHRQIQVNVERMRETLKDQVAVMDPAEYVAAKKFLTSLDFEGRHVQTTSGLAAR